MMWNKIPSAVIGRSMWIAFIWILSLGLPKQDLAWAEDSLSRIEIPQDLTPWGANVPAAVDEGVDHYDENGFPEDLIGLLVTNTDSSGYIVYLENIADPFLLYTQFVNTQWDAVSLAREGTIEGPLPNGRSNCNSIRLWSLEDQYELRFPGGGGVYSSFQRQPKSTSCSLSGLYTRESSSE